MYKEIKKMDIYKNAYVIGVFVPTKKSFKIKNLYRKILKDGKTLAFISTVDAKVTYRLPPVNSFNDVYEGDGVYEVSKAYKESREPDLILLECNEVNRSVYYGINTYTQKPIIGIYVPYSSGRSREVQVDFTIGTKEAETLI